MTNLLESCNWNTNGKVVYVIDLDGQVRDKTLTWPEAITNYLEGKVSIIMSHPTKRIRSAGGIDIAHPLIVQRRYWTAPKGGFRTKMLTDKATTSEILARDGHTCCYCSGKATTADHVKPRERCKRDDDPFEGSTWGNLVAACWTCNQRKRNRTPEEAGMEMLWSPFVSQGRFPEVQATVDHIMATGEGFHQEADLYGGIIERTKPHLRVVA